MDEIEAPAGEQPSDRSGLPVKDCRVGQSVKLSLAEFLIDLTQAG